MTYAILTILAAALLALAVLVVWLIGRSAGALAGLIARGRPNGATAIAVTRKLTYAATSAFFVYSAYEAVYPSDDFFLSEYAEVTSRQAPNAARVVAKSASYPDLHGDYCSFSRIDLGSAAYENVLRELTLDSRFSPGDGLGSQEEQTVQKQVPPIGVRKSFTRSVPSEADHFLAIRFLDDGAQVEVSVCVT